MKISKKIQEIVDNADKFIPFRPEKFISTSRFMFIYENAKKDKIILVMSNSTNEVELRAISKDKKHIEKYNIDLSTEENNLLCLTFERIISKIRVEQREKSVKENSGDLEKVKMQRDSKLDKFALEQKKSMQKESREFLKKINFNSELPES